MEYKLIKSCISLLEDIDIDELIKSAEKADALENNSSIERSTYDCIYYDNDKIHLEF